MRLDIQYLSARISLVVLAFGFLSLGTFSLALRAKENSARASPTGRQMLICRKQRKHSGGRGFLFGCVYLSKEMIQPAFGKKRALEFGHSLITAERSNRIAQAFRPG